MNLFLFDILDNGNRVIVHSNADDKCLYTWNKSLTLQCWQDTWFRGDDDSSFDEIDAQTLQEIPESYEAACIAAKTWADARK